MLQTLPGLRWEINFLHMVQRNVDVRHLLRSSRLCRSPTEQTGSYRLIARLGGDTVTKLKLQLAATQDSP
jgi:hypothetical protein